MFLGEFTYVTLKSNLSSQSSFFPLETQGRFFYSEAKSASLSIENIYAY